MPRYRVRCEIILEAPSREAAVNIATEVLIEGKAMIEYDGLNGMVEYNITGTEEIR